MNNFFDRYQLSEDGPVVVSSLFLGASIPFALTAIMLRSQYLSYSELESQANKGEIIDLNNLTQDQIEDMKHSLESEPKWALLSGMTISASTLKENNFDIRSSLSSIPPQESVLDFNGDRKHPYPKEILAIYDDYDSTTRQQYRIVASQFYLGTRSPFLIMPGYSTKYGSLKSQTTKSESYYSQLYRTFPEYVNLEFNTFKSLRHIVVEGEIVTVAGLVRYNHNLKEFQMSDVYWMVTGGWRKVVGRLLREWKRYYKNIIIAGLICIGIVGVCRFMLARRRQFLEHLRIKWQNEENERINQNLPANNWRMWGILPRTVILTPCYHYAVCEMCWRKYNYWPMCGFGIKFDGFISTSK